MSLGMERGWHGLSEFALIRSAEICPIRAIRVLFQLLNGYNLCNPAAIAVTVWA